MRWFLVPFPLYDTHMNARSTQNPYERFEHQTKLRWKGQNSFPILLRENQSIVDLFTAKLYMCVLNVCGCARMCADFTTLSMCYILQTRFRRRTTKIIETSKRWSFWAFVIFHTLTLTLMFSTHALYGRPNQTFTSAVIHLCVSPEKLENWKCKRICAIFTTLC